MQRYAEQLVAFSESQSGHADGNAPPIQVRAPTTNTPVSVIPQPAQPSRSSHSMGEYDSSENSVRNREEDPSFVHRNSTPRHSASAAPAPVLLAEDDRDPDSSVCSETDTDAETDDEPTIRANHSCASSETQSVCSTDTNDDDDDADESDFGFVPARRPPYLRRWTDASADPTADDGRMHSP